jgi:hypothetical protein
VIVSDGDLVFKLLSLPAEAREELLNLLGDPLAKNAAQTGEILLEHLAESTRHSMTPRTS